ncbi:response regulator [Herpetosiphon geysericola]|uniref:Uncharacterized protein n=1 Tax=Herpetosiphon geysericola TaxID=70996 RepID=A0A0P6YN43_9CHLR|nr:response regulator [Herpetosiphon geysericola]KPL91681.1 hypothetical protein SE18_01460 [Herpetosiphon geysericola]
MLANAEPILLFAEDAQTDATIVQVIAQRCGWQVVWLKSLFAMWQYCVSMLDREQPALNCVIMLDMKMPDPAYRHLEGSVLATWLSHAMHEQRLQTVPIFGMTTDKTVHREWEARIAGCYQLFEKPLRPEHFQQLQQYLGKPSPPAIDGVDQIAVEIIRKQHLDIMHTVIAAYQNQAIPANTAAWSLDELRVLLSFLTNSIYCPRHLQQQREQILERAGGLIQLQRSMRNFLSNPQLSTFELKILNRILQGVSQERIAAQEALGRRKLESTIEQILVAFGLFISN